MKRPSHYLPRAVAAGFVLALPAFAIEAPPHDAPPPPPAAAQGPAASGVGNLQADGAAVEGVPARPAAAVTYLGISASEVPGFLGKHIGLAPNTGLLVRYLDPEGPAAKAGFTADDVITKVEGKEVSSHGDLADLVLSKKPGDSLKIDYIHEGKPGNRSVVLGEHHNDQAALGGVMPDAGAVQNMLDNMPADQARKVREAIERHLKDMENLQADPAPGFGDLKDMEKRMRKMADDARAAAPQGMNQGGNKGGGIQMSSSATVRFLDNDGSVELKNRDGGTEIRVFDKAGKEVWSGPWDTEQDKAAAPKEIRDRIRVLKLESAPKGGGLRFHFAGGADPDGP
jgi:serine protease Do